MPLLNYTTTIEAQKTAGEVMGILATHGAVAIMAVYDGKGNITGISFRIETPQGVLPFRLPIDHEAGLKVMEHQRRQGKVAPRYVNIDQARRVAWRIVKDWVEAQMALLETEMARLEEVFLPYLLVEEGKTLYQRMADSRFLLEGPRD